MFLRLGHKRMGGNDVRLAKHFEPSKVYGGPCQSGAVGLPSGKRQGITGAYSLVGRTAFRNIPQIGAAQFGSQVMGAQRLAMKK